ncbi:MAG TPA: hypothetical protein VJH33_01690 [Candidatus Paceibacterota bacterium]
MTKHELDTLRKRYMGSTPLAVIIFRRCDSGCREFFFSTARCQPNVPEGFVPMLFDLPHTVVARPAVPDGIVKNPAQVVAVYQDGIAEEIPNPNPAYQPMFPV